MKPSPPKGTGILLNLIQYILLYKLLFCVKKGLHRYVLLVFLQSGKLDSSNIPDLSSNRSKFNTKEFMIQNGLQLIAGNFIQCEA